MTDPMPPSASRHPARLLLHGLRPTARWVLRRYAGVEVLGADAMPRTGAAIVAGNHVGALDGPLMAPG